MELLSSDPNAMDRYGKFITASYNGIENDCRRFAPVKAKYKENREVISRVFKMALHAAISGKRWGVLVCLVKLRLELLGHISLDSTDVATLNEYVSTAVDFAAQNGNTDLFHWVINPNDKKYKDFCGSSQLSVEGVACVVARALGQAGKTLPRRMIDSDSIEKLGKKPIMIGLTEAMRHDHRDIAKDIKSGLHSSTITDSDDKMLFLFCAWKDHPDVLKFWYEKLRSPDRQALFSADGQSRQFLTPLYLAAKKGSQVCSHLALEYWGTSVSVNAVYCLERFSALHVAAYYGHEDVVHLLLQQSEIDLQVKDVLGRTPLHYACGRGHLSVVLQLLQRQQVDHNLCDNNGITPLQMAVCAGHGNVVREWLSIRSGSGCFTECSSREAKAYTFYNLDSLFNFQQLSPEIILQQIKARMDGNNMTIGELYEAPNLIDSVFWSPGAFTSLHFAAALSHPEVLQELLTFYCKKELDEDLNEMLLLKDSMGFTAYDWAHARGSGQVFLKCVEASKGKDFVGKFTEKAGSIDEMKRAALDTLLKEIDRFEQWKKILKWCIDICQSLREHDMDKAKRLVHQASQFLREHGMDKARGLEYQAKYQELNIDCFGQAISQALIFHIFPRLENLDPLQVACSLSKKCMEDGTSRKGIEDLMIHLCQLAEFPSDVLERWLQLAIVFGFQDLAYHLIAIHKVNCNTVIDISYLTTQKAENLPSNGQLSPFKLAVILKHRRMQSWMAYRDDVKRGLYEDRQVYVDYANTILVGAVLIAGVAYQGWLQPPSGFDNDGDARVYRHSFFMQLYWWLNNISFFLAVATVIAAGLGAMPSSSNELLVDAVIRVHSAVSVASILFPMSMVCIMAAFAAAGYTILPNQMHTYTLIMKVTVICGAVLCSLFLLWFMKRLLDLNSNYKSARIMKKYVDIIFKNTMKIFFKIFVEIFLKRFVKKLVQSKYLQIFVKTGTLLIGLCATTIFLGCIAWPSLLVTGPLFLLHQLITLCACSYVEIFAKKMVKKLDESNIFQIFVKVGTLLIGFCATTVFLVLLLLCSLVLGPLYLLRLFAKQWACSYLKEGAEAAIKSILNYLENIASIYSDLFYMHEFCDF